MVVIEMNPRVSRSLGARVEGDRLPDREDRGEARGRLHARRDPERHHARDAGVLRADASTTSSRRSRASPSRSSRAPTPTLTTQMKSVGEAMAIGRTFKESAPEGAALARDRRTPGSSARRCREGAGGPRRALARRSIRRGPDARGRSRAAFRRGVCDRRGVPRARRSTRGSCGTSKEIVDAEARARAAARAGRRARTGSGRRSSSASPTGASRPSGRSAEAEVRALRHAARRAAGLQARRHLRRRVRGAHAVPLLDLRGRVRGAAHRPAARS